MKTKILCSIAAFLAILLISATNGFSFGSLGSSVNTACSPLTPYTGDCALCHTSNRSDPTAAKTAFLAGGTTLTDYFCPAAPPACTDNDNDTFAVEGGNCGPIDCDDTNAAINPDATENCNDTIDNNCNDLIDAQDPAAVGCLACTDNDTDTFALEGGSCGAIDCDDTDPAIYPGAFDIPNNGIDEDCSGADSVDPTATDNDGDGYSPAQGDCDDTDPAINPGAVDIPNNSIDENCDGADNIDPSIIDNDSDGFTPATGDCDDTDGAINPAAVELCTDGLDNDCNGLVDTQDINAVDCPQTCFDNDGDTYSIEGGICGSVDCNDNNADINPGVEEICDDAIDNDCDGSVDEGCDITCPDVDSDGFQDAACGGTDCNDNDAAINPGSTEIPGNSIDENCNGASDDTIQICPDGSLLVIKEMEYNRDDEKLHIKGRATVGTTITVINSDTGDILEGEIRVRKGKWEAEIENVGRALKSISVISSNGCAIVKEIETDEKEHEYREDDDEESKEKHRKKETRRKR